MADAAGGTRRALLGHSGADISLIEQDDGSFVRKQARRSGQNQRLRAQAAKQAWAHAAGIPTPGLRTEGEDNGLYWFDMDYLPGESLANGLISGRPIDWACVVAQIMAVLTQFRAGAGVAIDPACFPRKLADIARICAGRDTMRPLTARIERAVAVLIPSDWTCLPGGVAHGDLTLENMLLRPDGRLAFIDFDRPEQDSFVLDIGKLYQDLLGQWFLRQIVMRDPNGVDLLNARLNLARAVVHFDAALHGLVPGGAPRIRQLAAFHLLRTLPYATDPAIGDFVLGRVEALLVIDPAMQGVPVSLSG